MTHKQTLTKRSGTKKGLDMKDLFGTSNRAKHREAANTRTRDDLYLVGYDYEVFTNMDAVYLFNRSTGEFSFQHFGNAETAKEKALEAIKGARS